MDKHTTSLKGRKKIVVFMMITFSIYIPSLFPIFYHYTSEKRTTVSISLISSSFIYLFLDTSWPCGTIITLAFTMEKVTVPIFILHAILE